MDFGVSESFHFTWSFFFREFQMRCHLHNLIDAVFGQQIQCLDGPSQRKPFLLKRLNSIFHLDHKSWSSARPNNCYRTLAHWSSWSSLTVRKEVPGGRVAHSSHKMLYLKPIFFFFFFSAHTKLLNDLLSAEETEQAKPMFCSSLSKNITTQNNRNKLPKLREGQKIETGRRHLRLLLSAKTSVHCKSISVHISSVPFCPRNHWNVDKRKKPGSEL